MTTSANLPPPEATPDAAKSVGDAATKKTAATAKNTPGPGVNRSSPPPPPPSPRRPNPISPALMRNLSGVFPTLFAIVFIFFCLLFFWRQSQQMTAMHMARNATNIAEALNPNLIYPLQGAPADRNLPLFETLYSELKSVLAIFPSVSNAYLAQQTSDNRFHILMAMFLTQEEGTDTHVHTGKFCPDGILPALQEAQTQCKTAFSMPYEWEGQTFYGVCTPVTDPATGEVIAVLVLNTSPDTHHAVLWKDMRDPVLLFILCLVLAATYLFLRGTRRMTGRITLFYTAAMGLLLTGTLARMTLRTIRNDQAIAFYSLCDRKVQYIVQGTKAIREIDTSDIQHFLKNGGLLTDENIVHLIPHVPFAADRPLWSWAPVVEDAQRAAFEQARRDDGETDYQIWQWSPAKGGRIPAARADYYLPVVHTIDSANLEIHPLRAEPSPYNGLDLLSTRTAHDIQHAILTGLPVTGTLQNPMLDQPLDIHRYIIQAIRDPRDNSLAGVFFSPWYPQQLMNHAVNSTALGGRILLQLAFWDLDVDRPPIRIADDIWTPPMQLPSDFNSPTRSIWCYVQPIFSATRAYAILAVPTADFFANTSYSLVALIALLGLILTAACMLLVYALSRYGDILRTRIDQATAELSESEQRFRLLTEGSSDMIWVFDIELRRYTYVSPASVTILGFTPDELISLPPDAYLPPEYVDKINEDIHTRTLNHLEAPSSLHTFYREEFLYRHKDGHIVHTECISRYARNFLTGRLEVHGVTRDVTEQLAASQEIRRSHNRFATLLANLRGMVFQASVSDLSSMEFVSAGALELTGYDSAFFASHGFAYFNANIIAPESRERVLRTKQNALNTHTPFSCEYEIITASGLRKWVWEQSDFLYDDDGNTSQVEGYISDISTLKNTQVHLNNLAMAIEYSNDSILIASAVNDRILYANPATETLTGRPLDETIGLVLDDIAGHSIIDDPQSIDNRAKLKAGISIERTFEIEAKDGSPRTIHCSMAPVPDLDGVVSNYVIIQHDVTQAIQDTLERDSLRERLMQTSRLESIGRLAGGIAHDYNNMLQSILSYSELVLADLPEGSPIRPDVEAIRTAASRSAVLTSQLLAFARNSDSLPEDFDLESAISKRIDLFRHIVGTIPLQWNPSGQPLFVHMDPSHINQVLEQLLANACDALKRTSSPLISITIAPFEIEPTSAPPAPDALPPGTYLRLCVNDNGCGMTPEFAAHIFEPFYTTKSFGTDAGMGLPTVYGIVHQDGGTISVHTEQDHGTSIEIILPRHRAVPAPEAPASASAVEPALAPAPNTTPYCGTETILLVDDDESLLTLTSRILKNLGYTVLMATHPEEALHLLQTNAETVRLLLVDVIMPHMSGPQLVVEAHKLLPGLPVVYMSSYTSSLLSDHAIDPNVPLLAKKLTR